MILANAVNRSKITYTKQLCEFCGGKLSNSSPYILFRVFSKEPLTSLYEKYEFCSLKCLRSWTVRMGEL